MSSRIFLPGQPVCLYYEIYSSSEKDSEFTRDEPENRRTGASPLPLLNLAASIQQCQAQIECRVVQELPFEERTWFIGEVVAAGKQSDHIGTKALMCGWHE